MARILVVDDSTDTLHLVSATLESAGHEVIGVTDPLAALGALRGQSVDAAVLDVMMPGLSGWELLESIRREPGHERLPIVFLSAIGDSSNRTRGIRLGADDFLAKPFDPEELLVRIESLISRVPPLASGLAGGLDHHPLSEVIQGLEQNTKTGSLEIHSGKRRGTIFFAAGKIATADFDGYRDRTAVLCLLEETHGHFRFVAGPVEAGRTRFEPSALLIESAWIEDELAARRNWVPATNRVLALTGALPAVPEGLRGLPIHEVTTEIEAPNAATLGTLLADRRFSPSTVRLTVAWLVQVGVIDAGGPPVVRQIVGRSVERFLRSVPSLHPGQPAEIALIVHAPAWETVAPLVASLPEDLLDDESRPGRQRILAQRGGTVTLTNADQHLHLIFDTFHNPEGAIAGEALVHCTSIVLWVSEELTFEEMKELLRNVEAAAPSRSNLLVVGALGALARGPRWRAVPTTPESLEELLYELVEARN